MQSVRYNIYKFSLNAGTCSDSAKGYRLLRTRNIMRN